MKWRWNVYGKEIVDSSSKISEAPLTVDNVEKAIDWVKRRPLCRSVNVLTDGIHITISSEVREKALAKQLQELFWFGMRGP